MINISIVKGDIATQKADAIVNAANPSLTGGGGVDGAIHRAAGPQLLEECNKIKKEKYPEGLPTGEAVITKGYNLHAKFVIHTAGPVYSKSKDQSHLLANCFKNSLDIAEKNKLKSMVFPAISTGVYKYPKKEAAEIARRVLKTYNCRSLKKAVLCLFSDKDKKIFEKVFETEKTL